VVLLDQRPQLGEAPRARRRQDRRHDRQPCGRADRPDRAAPPQAKPGNEAPFRSGARAAAAPPPPRSTARWRTVPAQTPVAPMSRSCCGKASG
jgi:hypothetical protein